MKNIAFIVLLLAFSISSCTKEVDTIATITVSDITGTLENYTVYQFSEVSYEAFGADKFYADKSVVTDANGEAKFILNDDLELIAKQTTLYFVVFYTLNGSSQEYYKEIGVTVEKGDEVEKSIFLN